MKRILMLAIFSCMMCCFRVVSSVFGAEAIISQQHKHAPKVLPVVGLQFDEKSGTVPYSFYYPYSYSYYYPDTFGSKNTGQEEECYTRFENGTFFYQCD